jgi:hypothetical protein
MVYFRDGQEIGVRLYVDVRDLSLLYSVQTSSTSYPNGTGALSPGVKRQGSESDHSPATSVEVKNRWNYTTSPPYVFGTLCFIKHENCFIFTFMAYLMTLSVAQTASTSMIINEWSNTMDVAGSSRGRLQSLSWNLPGVGLRKSPPPKKKRFQSEQQVSQSRFQPRTSRIQVSNLTVTATLLGVGYSLNTWILTSSECRRKICKS